MRVPIAVRNGCALLFCFLFLGGMTAAAQEQAEERAEQETKPGLAARLKAWQERQERFGEGSYSLVRFEEDAFSDVFDKEWFPLVRFGGGFYPVKNLGVGISFGGMYEAGYAVGAITGERSGERTELYVLPVQVELCYRFLFVKDQPVVPVVRAGGDWWYFRELNEFEENVEGDKSGWHYGVDLDFLLDLLDPGAAFKMKRDFGIDNTYFYLSASAMQVGEAEEGLRFTGWYYTLGLRFEGSGR